MLCSNNFILKLSQNLKLFSGNFKRTLKTIEVKTEGNITTIEAKFTDLKKTENLFNKNPSPDFCPLCPKVLPSAVKYTDVLIISQFLDHYGEILPQHVTGLCYKAYKRLHRITYQAQTAGLIKRPAGHPDENLKWNKNHIFFDE